MADEHAAHLSAVLRPCSFQSGSSYILVRNAACRVVMPSLAHPSKTAESRQGADGNKACRTDRASHSGGMFMNVIRSNITVFAVVLTTALVATCGGNATLSPVGPSSASAGASISGTISGSVLAARLAIGSESFSVLDARGVTVTIIGTGISTTADNQGQFTLNNVPPGTVQLNFTGPG